MTEKAATETTQAQQPFTTENPHATDAPVDVDRYDAAGAEDPAAAGVDPGGIAMLLDVELKLTVELGRARLKIRDVMNLAPGGVIELSRLTSEPVDILVNDALLATGEVVVIDDHFAVRITKLLDRVERLKRVV